MKIHFLTRNPARIKLSACDSEYGAKNTTLQFFQFEIKKKVIVVNPEFRAGSTRSFAESCWNQQKLLILFTLAKVFLWSQIWTTLLCYKLKGLIWFLTYSSDQACHNNKSNPQFSKKCRFTINIFGRDFEKRFYFEVRTPSYETLWNIDIRKSLFESKPRSAIVQLAMV